MKPLFLFIAFLSFTQMATAQTMDSTIAKLYELNLLEKDQLAGFENYLTQLGGRNNAAYMYALFQAEYKKLAGRDYSDMFGSMNFGFKKLSEDVQLKINDSLRGYALKLNHAGLLTGKRYQSELEKINKNEYAHLVQLLVHASQQAAYNEWLSPDKIITYAEKLRANDVITNQHFEALKQEAKEEKIISDNQIIGYCNHALLFDLAAYSNDPAVYVEQIHRQVAGMLPELAFTNFKYKIEVDSAESFKDYTSYKLVVSLKINNKTYKQKSFISPNDIGKDNNYLGKIDPQQFYQIFNKVLADQQSPLRIHHARYRLQAGQNGNYQYFGMIALSKKQTAMFRYSGGYIDISYENFKNTLTSSRIDSAIKTFQQIGLLNQLSSEAIEAAKEKIRQQENKNLNNVLECFPRVIYTFDTELSNVDDPYAELIKEYANISQGQFTPTNISDDFNIEKNKKATLQFSFKGIDYKRVFTIDNDWIDADFFDFIKNVIAEHKLPGQFYDLYTGGQEASIIYLTPAQYDIIKANHLLVFADEEQYAEE